MLKHREEITPAGAQTRTSGGFGTCVWNDDEDGNWWTTCGEGWCFTDGGPIGNGMNYCPFCGKTLAEVSNV